MIACVGSINTPTRIYHILCVKQSSFIIDMAHGRNIVGIVEATIENCYQNTLTGISLLVNRNTIYLGYLPVCIAIVIVSFCAFFQRLYLRIQFVRKLWRLFGIGRCDINDFRNKVKSCNLVCYILSAGNNGTVEPATGVNQCRTKWCDLLYVWWIYRQILCVDCNAKSCSASYWTLREKFLRIVNAVGRVVFVGKIDGVFVRHQVKWCQWKHEQHCE